MPDIIENDAMLNGHKPLPLWNGREFELEGSRERILAYNVGNSGWSDALTELHERGSINGRHFMDVASRRHALFELKRIFGSNAADVIEIGCSSGYFLADVRSIMPNLRITGADYTMDTLRAVANKIDDVPLIRFDLTKCPLPSESYDGAVLINVLEHIEDHETAMHHVARILKPGGCAVLEVPAGPNLYDDYDRHLMHYRRYTLEGFCKLVTDAGLRIDYKNYFGALIYPAFVFAKHRSKKVARNDEELRLFVEHSIAGTAKFNFLGHAIMQAERILARAVLFPAGIRCMVTAKKPS